jgi:hypothetical protein
MTMNAPHSTATDALRMARLHLHAAKAEFEAGRTTPGLVVVNDMVVRYIGAAASALALDAKTCDRLLSFAESLATVLHARTTGSDHKTRVTLHPLRRAITVAEDETLAPAARVVGVLDALTSGEPLIRFEPLGAEAAGGRH